MVIAYRYTGDETTVLREIFHLYDTECTGTLSLGELRNAFSIHEDLDEEDVDQIFLALVSDNDTCQVPSSSKLIIFPRT